jgi:hypothetical protein
MLMLVLDKGTDRRPRHYQLARALNGEYGAD